MSKAKQCPRSQAALAIKSVLIDKQSLTQAIAEHTIELNEQDRSLCKALCFGVMRHFFSLDAGLQRHLSKKLRNKDYDIYALLLLGSYQLKAMRLPDYAAINSCVEACQHLRKPWAKELVNAVLRKVQGDTDAEQSPSAIYEHPDWLIGKIKKAWPEQAEAIFQANNSQAPFCLRINQQKTTRSAFAALLEQQGIAHHFGKLSDVSLYLDDKPQDITALVGFSDGLFSVQDEAPQLCAQFLDLAPELRVLDACAAPGGKTCHMLEQEPALADMLAVDIDDFRLEKVEENLERLSLQARTLACDITLVDQWYEGEPFDRILCDVPCSATGVIRRHPDIKLLRQADDIKALVALQSEILHKLWALLKPGGILLYATCSILPEENSRQIKQFLATTADALEEPIHIASAVACEHGMQLLPNSYSHDGFYYAKLRKNAG